MCSDGANIQYLGRHFARIPHLSAVKMGAQGSYLRQGDREVWIDPCPIIAVDTVGAGDAFDAGFNCRNFRRDGFWADIGRFANAVAALTCRDVGLCAQPTREEAQQFLASLNSYVKTQTE